MKILKNNLWTLFGLALVLTFAMTGDAFAQNTNLKTLTICGTDLEIRDNAFESCTSLETVILKDGVYCVWAEAFKNCTNLKAGENALQLF